MKTRLWIAAGAAASVVALAGCAGGPNQQLGTAGGAVAGGVIGHAIGGNTAATVGGAAIGGIIGNQVGRNADQRQYDNSRQGYYGNPGYYNAPGYYNNPNYYPYNGPTH